MTAAPQIPKTDPQQVKHVTQMLHDSWNSKRHHLFNPASLSVTIKYTINNYRVALVASVEGRSTLPNKGGESCDLPASVALLSYRTINNESVDDDQLAILMLAAIETAKYFGWSVVPRLCIGA